jgi:ubiquinone/menaquinone biosynthesis C-methylase UbiE
MSSDTKQAEKAYLQRSGSLAWEQVKPFSPAGTQTLGESLRLMHDFAVAADALGLAPGHRVLDLGAGACWTTEWLARLNVDVVAMDIAHDMLRVGRTRCAGTSAGLAAGDFEALPFADGAFDRALCLNALHHVPDPAAALREIRRVLNAHGRLVLIEPGRGHAERETSQVATREFGVLEQELEATQLMRLCHEAGFAHVVVRPLSYMTGEIALDLEQVTRWQTWARKKRPERVLQKFRLLARELTGGGKQDELFEDALGMWISRVLLRHISEQSVVVADTRADNQGVVPYSAAIEAIEHADIEAGSVIRIAVRVRNTGSATWAARSPHPVFVGLHVRGEDKAIVARDYHRVAIAGDVRPGEVRDVEVRVPRPASGAYVQIDLVAEGLTWFDTSEQLVRLVR